MLLQISFVMLCLVVMTHISRHLCALSKSLVAQSRAAHLRKTIDWTAPARRR